MEPNCKKYMWYAGQWQDKEFKESKSVTKLMTGEMVYVPNHTHMMCDNKWKLGYKIKFHSGSMDVESPSDRIKSVNISHLWYIHMCDTICGILETAKDVVRLK